MNLKRQKACNAVNALELIDVDEDDIKEAGLVAGYCGPFGLPSNINFIIDEELKDEVGLYFVGANEENYHLVNTDLSDLKDAKFLI